MQASPELAKLRTSYVQVDLDAWVPYLDQAVATANAINAMRTPTTNPFTQTIKTLQGVVDTIQDIRGNMLDSLSTTVKQFNGVWHNNASVAFEVGLVPSAGCLRSWAGNSGSLCVVLVAGVHFKTGAAAVVLMNQL